MCPVYLKERCYSVRAWRGHISAAFASLVADWEDHRTSSSNIPCFHKSNCKFRLDLEVENMLSIMSKTPMCCVAEMSVGGNSESLQHPVCHRRRTRSQAGHRVEVTVSASFQWTKRCRSSRKLTFYHHHHPKRQLSQRKHVRSSEKRSTTRVMLWHCSDVWLLSLEACLFQFENNVHFSCCHSVIMTEVD